MNLRQRESPNLESTWLVNINIHIIDYELEHYLASKLVHYQFCITVEGNPYSLTPLIL